MANGKASPKTLLVGLDAACWEYLDPLLRANRLPNLARLIGKGTHGKLRSCMPPITPAAWSSLATGVNPGKHGIFEWVQRKASAYQFDPVTSRQRIGTPVWTRLNQAGIRTGVINIPLTYPVKAVDGFMVCGFSAPASAQDLTYPQDVLSEIEAKFGHYRPDVEKPQEGHSSPQAYQAEREHQFRLVRIATYLANRRQVQALIINLMLLDHANHTMPDMEIVEQAIIDSDFHLGLLLAEFSPDNVLLISDHGSRRVRGVFLLSAWLAEQGLLSRRERPIEQQSQIVNYLLSQWKNGKPNLASRIGRRLAREGLLRLPGPLTAPVWSGLERDIPLARLQTGTLDQFSPENTQVYEPASHRGNFYLNIAGREPQGIVPPQEKEPLLEKLCTELRDVVDPETGERLFANLYRPSELYSGPFVGQAPDLTGDYYASRWSIVSKLPGLKRRDWRYFLTGERWHGDHSQDGIYVFSGQAFCNQETRQQADLLDVPASLLYLHGVPLPDDYDGRPLLETMRDDFVRENPIQYQPGDDRESLAAEATYSLTGEAELLARLSALGYIDE
jgi:predicted AlkP superfamily phosphohydrolase/phosphomutase